MDRLRYQGPRRPRTGRLDPCLSQGPPLAENIDLRRGLDQATTCTSPSVYKSAIERLRQVFGHSIAVLPHDYGPYNRGEPEPSCYALAFGLAAVPRYLQLVAAALGPDGQQPLNARVVTCLLAGKVLRRRRVASKIGDVVLYFAQGEVKHGGVVIAQRRIRSKWGRAEVHQHGLWEVPLEYGDTAEVYLAPNPTRILAFVETEVARKHLKNVVC